MRLPMASTTPDVSLTRKGMPSSGGVTSPSTSSSRGPNVSSICTRNLPSISSHHWLAKSKKFVLNSLTLNPPPPKKKTFSLKQLNGITTQGENIADNGGVREALRALKMLEEDQGKPEPGLPGLQNYSNDQLFFISFAQVHIYGKIALHFPEIIAERKCKYNKISHSFDIFYPNFDTVFATFFPLCSHGCKLSTIGQF